jgi:mannosyltransferase OCH1-like enzyme
MERFQLGLLVILTLVLILMLKFVPKPDGRIPKIIHQTAPADRSKWHAIWTPCQKSWRTQFPDWEYKMWTDEDLEDLIKTKYSWLNINQEYWSMQMTHHLLIQVLVVL